MRTIYKYTMNVQTLQRFDMPVGAKPLTVQIQNGDRICLWMEVEAENEQESIPVYIIGTGNSFPDKFNGAYVGSVQMGYFVWHIYIGAKE